MAHPARVKSRALAPTTNFDVIVVGRGAVGAATALGLAQSGLRTAILAPAFPTAATPQSLPPGQGDGARLEDWDPRVFALSPASRALLERLRVWDALDATRVAPVHEMRVYPSAAADAPELSFDAYDGCVDALAWIVEGRNLASALDRALAFAGVASVDARLVDIACEPAASTATVVLDDGRELHARLVVGADGAASPLRAAAGIEATERLYPQRAVVANFATEKPHRDCAYQWFGGHGILALLPLPGERCSMVWSAPLPLAETLLEPDPKLLAQRVNEVARGRLGNLRVITPQQAYPATLGRLIARRVKAARWHISLSPGSCSWRSCWPSGW